MTHGHDGCLSLSSGALLSAGSLVLPGSSMLIGELGGGLTPVFWMFIPARYVDLHAREAPQELRLSRGLE